jgi:hypothetical protein
MSTIKTQLVSGQRRIITKVDGGQRRVSCSCCDAPPECQEITLNSEGGDAGYDETFTHQSLSTSYNTFVVFTAFFIADELLIFANGNQIYTTGCIGTEVSQPSSVSAEVTIPENTTSIRIKVNPLCGPTSEGTLWTLFVSNLCLEQ